MANKRNKRQRGKSPVLKPAVSVGVERLVDQGGLREGKTRSPLRRRKRISWTFILALVSAVATLVGSYFAYLSYQHSIKQLEVGLALYKLEGDKDRFYDTMVLAHEDVIGSADSNSFGLPLRVQNPNIVQLENIAIWITPVTEGVQLELDDNCECNWIVSRYSNTEHAHTTVKMVTALTAVETKGITVRAPKDIHEAKLNWTISASNAGLREGTFTIYF